MKSQLLILFALFSFCISKAEDRVYERVYVHTDKDCYVAGEDIRLKFYVIDRNFQPSGLSKAGYVEICDTEKPRIQLKVALEKGSGLGEIRIPQDIPSGIYRLSGYTRYMRNEGDTVFFKKQIAIVNAGQQVPNPKRFELVEKYENLQPERQSKESSGLSIKTDQSDYGNRQKVVLSLDNIPDNTADLVISVSRNDSIAFAPEANKQDWLKQVRDTFPLSGLWLPEYEGHIITGKLVPKPQPEEQLLSSIAFVGKDIHYINGQVNPDGTADFYTSEISGNRQIVTSVVSQFYDKVPYRMDIISPFSESLPVNLPILKIYPNQNRLTERYIGAQLLQKSTGDSVNNPVQSTSDNIFLQPLLSYDLDQYTRFGSIGETILEFISRVRVAKVGDHRRIEVFMEEDMRFSLKNTLVLLDGIPVYDHEDILNYNPLYIKRINVYDGRYLFGGEIFEGIVSFQTREGNLPFFQLSDNSQLLNYDCPQLPLPFKTPEYSGDKIKNSRKPDFRSTLYWNPQVEFTKGKTVNLSFYTSDLSGEFEIKIEGITTDGKPVQGVSYFRVIPIK